MNIVTLNAEKQCMVAPKYIDVNSALFRHFPQTCCIDLVDLKQMSDITAAVFSLSLSLPG